MVEPRPAALRFHPLRRHGPRRNRGSRAPHERADPAQHRGRRNQRHAARSGHRHRRHGAVRRKIRRRGARGHRARFQHASCAAARTCAAPAISASARSSTRAASRPACGASKPSPAKRRCGNTRNPPARCSASPSWCTRPSRNWSSTWRSCWPNERALEHQVKQLKEKLAQSAAGALEAQARAVNGIDACWRRASKAWTASRCARWPIRCATSGSRAVVVLASADDGGVAIVCGGHQGPDRQGAGGQTGGRAGAGRGRQGRRAAGHGRRRRQGCRRAGRRAGRGSRAKSRAKL